MNRRLTFALVILVLIPAAGIVYLLGTPRLENVSPAADEANVPAAADLRLVFSRSMQPASVTDRLSLDPSIPGSFSWDGKTLIFKPDTIWPSGEKITVSLAAGARAAGLLSLPVRENASWSFTIGQPRLAYLYPADKASNIYVLNPSTDAKQRLTDSPGGVLEFDISPDGKTIYYSVRNDKNGSSIYRLEHLDTIEEDGQDGLPLPTPILVLDCQQAFCRAPQISPQGDYLAYERTDVLGSGNPTYPQVWLMPIHSAGEADSQPGEPVLAGDQNDQTLQPAWSPSGILTFYDSTSSAFVMLDPHGGDKTTFHNETGEPGAWDPQGKVYVASEISFSTTGNPEQTGLTPIANSHLIQFDRAKKTSQDLSKDENLEDTTPAFSPDGTWLAFARKYLDAQRWTPGRQVWLMHPDGSEARQLTNDPLFNHYEFAWAPTGKQLAYVRFNQTVPTEPPEIWMVDPVSTRSTRLVAGGYAPQWTP